MCLLLVWFCVLVYSKTVSLYLSVLVYILSVLSCVFNIIPPLLSELSLKRWTGYMTFGDEGVAS